MRVCAKGNAVKLCRLRLRFILVRVVRVCLFGRAMVAFARADPPEGIFLFKRN